MRVSDLTLGRKEICSGNLERAPKVSIITPTYKRNLEGLLAPCIESALSQSFSDIELIVIDDGSSDGTEETVRRYAARDDRLRYFRHNKNSGLPAVRTNEGIMLARGDSIAFLFDDNVLERDFISRAYKELQSFSVDVVHANVHMLGVGGADFTLGDWPLCRELLGNLNTIPNGGVLCRRSFFEKYGLYDPHILLRRICDWDLWLRSMMLGASFRHLNVVAATEHGLVSKNSIGNTVRWDVKVAYGYMFDAEQYAERAARLHPGRIGEVDVLDTEVVLPYVRTREEWLDVVKTVYEPFLAVNEAAKIYPTDLTNRAEIDNFGYGQKLQPTQGRRRSLVVSNTFNSGVELWTSALSEDDYICLHVPEWQLSAIPPECVDLLVLLDCCASFLSPVADTFARAGVPIIYMSKDSSSDPSEDAFNLARLSPIEKVLGKGRYFPCPGVPFTSEQRKEAARLQSLSTAILVPSGKKLEHDWQIELTDEARPALLRDVARFVRLFRSRNKNAKISRPRALVALNSELLSGSEAYGIMLGQLLQSLGIDVQMWTPQNSVYGLRDGALGARLIEVGLPPFKGAPYEPGARFLGQPPEIQAQQVNALNDALSLVDPDLIVCSGFMPVFARAHRRDALLVAALFQPSAYDPEHLKMIADDLDAWISDSRWSQSILKDVLGGTTAVVRSIVTQRSLHDAPVSSRQVRIAVGGTLQPRKGQIYAIRALRLLLDRGIDAMLNVYGYSVPALQWYKDELEAAIVSLKLEDRVVIHGLKDLDEIASANDLILSSSIDESLPQTVAECMVRGLIPVAVRSGGIDELVIDGTNGFVVKDHAPAKITDSLAKAIHRRSNWGEMRAASASVLSEYSIEKARSSLIALIEIGLHSAQSGRLVSGKLALPALAPAKDQEWHARVAKLESFKQTLRIANTGIPPCR
jgi:glycosyltransferase involved in cell wall biosynthesis